MKSVRGTIEMQEYNNSTVHYLQSLAARKCDRLPENFVDLEHWETYKSVFLSNLKRILPLLQVHPTGDDRVLSVMQLGTNAVIEEVQVCVDEDYYIKIHLYLPKNCEEPAPCVMVCPGYLQEKRAGDIVDMCMALAKNKIAAAAVEYSATGSCGDRPDGETNLDNVVSVAACLGINDVAIRTAHNMAVLRYLKTRPEIAGERIGITGICQGSIVLWFTAALCDEFKAMAPLCGTTTLEAEILEYTSAQGGWSGTSPFVYNLLEYGDVPHIYASFAPRPLLVMNNIIDRHWPYSGLQKVKDFCDKIYGLHQAQDKVCFRVEHQKHSYDEIFIEAIVCFFQEYL